MDKCISLQAVWSLLSYSYPSAQKKGITVESPYYWSRMKLRFY